MKKNIGINELFQITKDTINLHTEYANASEEKILKNTELICNSIDKINQMLLMSRIRGINGVISNLKLYKDICVEIKGKAEAGTGIEETDIVGLDLLSERILDKTKERLYPNDEEFVRSRYTMADQLRAYATERIDQYVEENALKETLSSYNKIYIYEEDFESLTMRRILNSYGIDGFECFVAEADSYRIDGSKIVSLSEANICDEDVLLLTAREALRKYDYVRVAGHDLKNIIEVAVFDDNTEDAFVWSLVE